MQLSKGEREKLLLTETELLMLFTVLGSAVVGVENLVQHYSIWLLAFGTDVRPGSITVGPGYARSSKLPNGQLRGVDETLRWKDVKFFKKVSNIDHFPPTIQYLR